MSKHQNEEYVCSMCEAEPQDILILSCSHNLCLLCAAQLVFLNLKGNQLTCQICLSQTTLDNDTINCLTAMSATSSNIKNTFTHQRTKLPPKSSNQEVGFMKKQQLKMCQLHNQQIIYFCFDCSCMNICSECMLDDNHKNHQIFTLKKAAILIQEKMKDLNRQKQRIKNLMIKDREQLILKKQQSQNEVQRQKQQLKQTFDKIVKIISQRYNQINTKIQQTVTRHVQIIQGSIAELSNKISLIQQTMQFQQELLKNLSTKNQYMHVLQYYCDELIYPVNLQPNLPNTINCLNLALNNKDQIINQINQICKGIQVTLQQNIGQNNINQISVIENENFGYNMHKIFKPQKKRKKSQFKNSRIQKQVPRYDQMEDSNYSNISHSNQNSRHYQNVKVIVGENYKKGEKRKNFNKESRKKIRDNQDQLQQRKLQMSRSIMNATNIINKIQQRVRRT